MPSVARRCTAAALVASVIAVACKDAQVKTSSDRSDHSNATFASRDTNRALGPGDVRITNADSSIEIAVVRDSIITGFGPRVLAEIQKGTDTTKVKGDGFGANIEKLVKSTVASAMNHEMKYAVADVQSMRYIGGKLELYWKDGSRMKLFENTKQNNKPVSETFSEADAKQLIAAFDAKKAALGSKS
jgi:hypothetical protein